MFKLTKYGWPQVLIATALAAGACGVSLWLSWPHPIFSLPVLVLMGVVWGWVLWFFRDPDRAIPWEEGLFVSPCDGAVSDITPVGEGSEIGRAGVKIGVFMNVFSVHVNRSPCAGRVVSVKHSPGAFMDVRDPAAFARNESTLILLEYRRGGQSYPVAVRQVAGLIARRIVTDLAPGQELARGERIGMIKFGSRCELIVPEELAGTVRVKIGQKVHAGSSVLLAEAKESVSNHDRA